MRTTPTENLYAESNFAGVIVAVVSVIAVIASCSYFMF